MDKGWMIISSATKRILWIMTAVSFFLGLSCSKEFVEKKDYSYKGKGVVIIDGGALISVRAKKTQNLYYKKKPQLLDSKSSLKNERQNDEIIKSETISASLDLIAYEGGKRKVLLQNFLEFNPKYCEGILDGVSLELLKGEQNVGKMGLFLPLYKIGCLSPDWAVYDINKNKLYALSNEVEAGKEIKMPLFSEGGGFIYKGERNYLITSALFKVFATLSKNGKMILFNDKGKKLYERGDILSFCFHPKQSALFFGSEKGLFCYDWEKKKEFKLGAVAPRLIRVSQGGEHLLVVEIGGKNIPRIFKLSSSAKKIEREIIFDEEMKSADDWVFVEESKFFGIFNKENGSFILEKNLKSQKTRIIRTAQGNQILLINSGEYPSIIAYPAQKGVFEKEIFYFDHILCDFKSIALKF